jgi:multiple sugar transport system substrate-binding protein
MLSRFGRKRELACAQVEARLTAYLKGGLSLARRQAMRTHLATCKTCARAAREAEALEAELIAEASRYHPTLSPQASARIQERVYRRMRRGLIMQRLTQATQRVVAIVAMLALAVGALALWRWMRPSIEKTAYTGESAVITFACMDFQRDRYQDLAQEFHRLYPAINVTFVSVEEATGNEPNVASSDDIFKIATAADTFLGSSHYFGWIAPQDVVLGLTELAEQDKRFELDDFYASPLNLVQKDGKLWGLPFRANVLLVYYNPELFDAAGVPYPQIGWSWDDFVETTSRLTVREGETVKQYGYMDPWPYYTLPLLAHQKAGLLIDDGQEPPVARLDSPGVAEALQWYADLIRVHGVMPDPFALDDATRQLFPHRQSPGMWMGFSYSRDNFPKAGVVPLPEAGEAVGSVSAYAYFVSAGTAHPEAAWRWIEFLSRQPLDRYASGIPARRSTAEDMRYWKKLDGETSAAYQYALERAVNYPSAIYGPLSNAWKAVLEGEPAETTLVEAQERANAQLAQAAATEAAHPAKPISVATPAPTPTPGGVQIRFLTPSWDMSPYRRLVQPFKQAHPEVDVKVADRGDLHTPRELAAAGDCFVAYAQLLSSMEQEALLPLDPLVAQDETFDPEAFPPAFLELVQIDGTLWGLPLATDTQFLYYNRALFDAAGAPCPTADWTPEQFMTQAETFTDLGAADPIYGFSPGQGAYGRAPYYVTWLGGRLFGADGLPTFDDPTVIKAVERYVALIANAAPPAATNHDRSHWFLYTSGAHPASVAAGRAAMWSDSFRNRRHHASPLNFEVGVVPLPVGTVPLNEFRTQALFISAQTPHPDACWNWIAFLSAQSGAMSELPVRFDVVADDDWREQVGEATADAWLTVLNRLETVRFPWSDHPAAYSALFWLDQALVDVFAGARPADALRVAQAKAVDFADCLSGRESDQEAVTECVFLVDPEADWPFE